MSLSESDSVSEVSESPDRDWSSDSAEGDDGDGDREIGVRGGDGRGGGGGVGGWVGGMEDTGGEGWRRVGNDGMVEVEVK